MAVFEYTALSARGKSVRGVIDADSVRGARLRLKQQGIFPTSLQEAHDVDARSGRGLQRKIGGQRISLQQLAVATRQLSTLVGAGIPLVEALKALGDQLDHARLKRVFAEVCDSINEGSTLADGLRQYPNVFPKLYVNLVASGEASGSLEIVLLRLADLLESQADLRRKVVSASVYPVLMLLLCFGVIVLLLTLVIPQIVEIFAERKAVLPLPTRVVISLSNFTTQYWPLVLGVMVASALGFERYGRSIAGRKRIDRFKLRAPITGQLSVKLASARFARTLGTMLASGIELLTALSIVKNIVGNVVIEEAVEQAANGVREGKSLAAELGKAGVFPKLLVHMTAIGERTGQLEPMLLRAATNYESEVDAFVSGFTKILEPILILFIACIVGGILFSVMLPMMEMSSLAS